MDFHILMLGVGLDPSKKRFFEVINSRLFVSKKGENYFEILLQCESSGESLGECFIFAPPVVERSAQVLAQYPSFGLVPSQLPCSFFVQLTSRLNLSCQISHKHKFDGRDIREPILFFCTRVTQKSRIKGSFLKSCRLCKRSLMRILKMKFSLLTNS